MSPTPNRPPGSTEGPLPGSHWLTGMIFDPTGRVFGYGGEHYREVYPAEEARVRAFFAKGLAQELSDKGLLVPTEISDLAVPSGQLVLKHQRVPFITLGHEWSRTQLRDAALTWLDLNLALAPHGLGLVDAHWGNFAQLGCCRPVWLDFGSIIPLRSEWQALEEFHQYYSNPLSLVATSGALSGIGRRIVRTGGVSDAELSSLGFRIPLGRRVRQLSRRVRGAIEHRLQKRAPTLSIERRVELLQQERREIAAIRFPAMATTWGDYHPPTLLDNVNSLPANPRREAILETITRLQPKRVIDLAGNAGFYSFFAARQGAEVLSLDFDELAIERLYEFAQARKESIQLTCAVADVMRPPIGRQDLHRTADLVLALALLHHLTLGQGFSIPTALEAICRNTTDKLMIEFMPNGLGGDVCRPDPLPDWYNRAIFEAELHARFEQVSIICENKLPQWRALYLAEGKR